MNEIITPEEAAKPMRVLIDLAISYGYEYDDRLSTYDHVKNIRLWAYNHLSLWTWISYSHGKGFTPYYIDISKPYSIKEKTHSTDIKEEALTEILIKAIKSK